MIIIKGLQYQTKKEILLKHQNISKNFILIDKTTIETLIKEKKFNKQNIKIIKTILYADTTLFDNREWDTLSKFSPTPTTKELTIVEVCIPAGEQDLKKAKKTFKNTSQQKLQAALQQTFNIHLTLPPENIISEKTIKKLNAKIKQIITNTYKQKTTTENYINE